MRGDGDALHGGGDAGGVRDGLRQRVSLWGVVQRGHVQWPRLRRHPEAGWTDNVLLPTGMATAMCKTVSSIFDLSGNANEWTSTVTGDTGAPEEPAHLHGEGRLVQDDPAAGLTCQFNLSRFASEAILPSTGRCCRNFRDQIEKGAREIHSALLFGLCSGWIRRKLSAACGRA